MMTKAAAAADDDDDDDDDDLMMTPMTNVCFQRRVRLQLHR